jgi:hypothetical protein
METKKAKLEEIITELRKRYTDKPIPNSISQLCEENGDLFTESTIRNLVISVYNQEIRAFLVEQKLIELNEGGRPVNTDFHGIVDTLLSRYPEGAKFEKMDDLKADNSDLAPKFKTLANNATKVFGVGLMTHFKAIGLLIDNSQEKQAKKRTKNDAALKEREEKLQAKGQEEINLITNTVVTLKERYADEVLPDNVSEIRNNNADLPIERVCKLAQKHYNKTAFEFLFEQGIIDPNGVTAVGQAKVAIMKRLLPDNHISKLSSDELTAFINSFIVPFDISDSAELKGKCFNIENGMECRPVSMYSRPNRERSLQMIQLISPA